MNRSLLLPFVLTLVMLIVMRWQGNSLVKPGFEKGIIHFEFAQSPEQHARLMQAWRMDDVRLNIYLDFIFILAYTWLLTVLSITLSKTGGWNKAGKLMAGLSLLAGILDLVENICMLYSLDHPSLPLLQMIYFAALVKFILVGIVIIYIIIVFISKLLRNRKAIQV